MFSELKKKQHLLSFVDVPVIALIVLFYVGSNDYIIVSENKRSDKRKPDKKRIILLK